jgi:hypothetical protein
MWCIVRVRVCILRSDVLCDAHLVQILFAGRRAHTGRMSHSVARFCLRGFGCGWSCRGCHVVLGHCQCPCLFRRPVHGHCGIGSPHPESVRPLHFKFAHVYVPDCQVRAQMILSLFVCCSICSASMCVLFVLPLRVDIQANRARLAQEGYLCTCALTPLRHCVTAPSARPRHWRHASGACFVHWSCASGTGLHAGGRLERHCVQ